MSVAGIRDTDSVTGPSRNGPSRFLSELLGTKGQLAALSFVIYTWWFSPVVAAGLMLSLFLHEAGHVWAMRRRGYPSTGIYLIPFFGAVAVGGRAVVSRSENAFISIMGPVFGLLSCPVVFLAVYLMSGSRATALGATEGAVILNLFNLLPLAPLDGEGILGSVVFSVNRRAGLAFASLGSAAACFAAWQVSPLFLLALPLGYVHLRAEMKFGGRISPMSAVKCAGWSCAFVGVWILGAAMLLTVEVSRNISSHSPPPPVADILR